jgi:hypothetical protein
MIGAAEDDLSRLGQDPNMVEHFDEGDAGPLSGADCSEAPGLAVDRGSSV